MTQVDTCSQHNHAARHTIIIIISSIIIIIIAAFTGRRLQKNIGASQ